MRSSSFERFAGGAALLAGICGFLYAVSFVILRDVLLSALFLMLTAVIATPVWVALYQRLRAEDESFALWAFLLAFVGAVGTAIHGGYDLANAVNVPAGVPAGVVSLPSQVDPRGLLAFGLTGAGIFTAAWLIGRSNVLPRAMAPVGYALGVLLVVLYLARLTILNPANPVILVPVLLTGFILSPVWYIWLGLTLLNGETRSVSVAR